MKLKLLFILLLIGGYVQSETPVVQWSKLITYSKFNSYPYALASDDNGNVFVAGLFTDSITIGTIKLGALPSKNAMYVARYDSLGNVLWAKKDGSSEIENSYCTVDKDGNFIICGTFFGNQATFGAITLINTNKTSNKKYFVVKYSPTGDVIWARTTPDTYDYCQVTAVAADKFGNIYATGYFQDPTITFGSFTITKSTVYQQDLFILKYDSSGNVLWAKGIFGDGGEMPNGLSTDPSGNVYITGYFNGTSISFDSQILNNASKEQSDVFIAKYSPNGNVLWAQNAGGIGSDIGNSISVDKDGNAYVGGDFTSATFQIGTKVITNPYKMDKCFLAKYDTSGNILWARSSINTNTGGDKICSVVADGFGNVYGLGNFTSQSLNFGSNTIWNSSYNFFKQAFYNPFNNPFNLPTDGFMSKYDANGNVIWLHKIGGFVVDAGHISCVDGAGNMYFTGVFSSDNIIYTSYIDPNEAESISKFFKVKGRGSIVAKVFSDSTYHPYDVYFCDESPITLTCPPDNNYPTWFDKNNKILGNDQTLNIANPIDSAIFYCKFKDARDSIFITSYRLIRTGPIADFSIRVTDCKSNNIQFNNLSTAKQGILSFVWDFGDGTTSTATNPQHKYTTNGIHRVSLVASTGSSGCSITVSKDIPDIGKPNVKITGDSILCNDGPVTLKVQGADTYIWSNGSTADSIKVASEQRVWVLGYSASGCVSDTTFQSVHDLSPRPGISGSFKFCPGTSTVLHARGAYRYEWSDGTSADTMVVSKDTTIWMIGYSVAGCHSDTLKLHIKQLPDNNLTIDGNLTFCMGDSTTLTASGAKYYSWNTGETTEKITVNKPGLYTVTGRNQTNCTNTLSVNVRENPLPLVDFSLSDYKVDSRNNSVTVTAKGDSDLNYLWDMGDGTTETAPTFKHYYNIDNTKNEYIITLTGINHQGCSNTKTIKLNVEIFIPNIFSPNRDGINDIFMPGVNLEVFNRNGMTLYKGLSGWDGNYNGKEMPDDTYYYVVSYKDNKGQVQIKKGYIILKR